ncbi:ubiquinol-cytochrome c reductase core subunit 1 [Elasticomyces elasticus]|uniref:Cytochrome b-c1 complex subunit 2, mitochondrial n=1 Tax=Exophiala sideris TaxID=1016849 RepID=A0A0D1ZJX9_9EURO|nr:ubiquinol-cytochrome c reductase core subunit 1 [Elasticomyces elasticus]KAK5033292.1 ubiquinol-cytochrome c reductase core subunit 1 [Exophiala sideris]KAK5185478.1 ubiquinol-cytochrome c reductase core subunit 1 [Eurotiomycetes sp. CCFEE 6388]KAK5042210.1 ubiquinol-cytochrome c reductase core subunit 1 [Exophiala sideris]KAK5063836.1 ubiquinol-cytochrome c reductase core subunit 1 [Exophiala sideris]
MASPASLGSRALRASRRQLSAPILQKRGLAAPASGSFGYETGEANGVKFASRDLPNPTTTLTVVAKAGTRYQPLPGLTDALEKFAFLSTEKRSALRITREVELLGGETSASHSRENLVLRAKFLRDDLPYFAELLGEVVSKTRYTTHELNEDVLRVMKIAQHQLLASPAALALNSVHGVAFHRGLGEPLYATSSTPLAKYVDAENVFEFSQAAYQASNIAVVANGASHSEVSKWVKEFFSDMNTGSSRFDVKSPASKYYGGEERIAHGSGNVLILGFPGSSSFTTGSSYKPEISVLAALLGGESSIKWSPGFSLLSKAAKDFPGAHVSTTNDAYSDAGLLYVTIKGSAEQVGKASKGVVDALKKVASGDVAEEDIKKATVLAKYRALEAGQQTSSGLEATGTGLIAGGKPTNFEEIASSIDKVSSDKVKAAAKGLLESKASVSAVGDLFALPFAEEIGLKV